jgi:hypothetical protein
MPKPEGATKRRDPARHEWYMNWGQVNSFSCPAQKVIVTYVPRSSIRFQHLSGTTAHGGMKWTTLANHVVYPTRGVQFSDSYLR